MSPLFGGHQRFKATAYDVRPAPPKTTDFCTICNTVRFHQVAGASLGRPSINRAGKNGVALGVTQLQHQCGLADTIEVYGYTADGLGRIVMLTNLAKGHALRKALEPWREAREAEVVGFRGRDVLGAAPKAPPPLRMRAKRFVRRSLCCIAASR